MINNKYINKIKMTTFAILFVLSMSSTSWAATYYVAKNGSDSNLGTEVTPWLTIGKAASSMTAGDTVYIKNGTYTETIVPRNSGSSGSGYITYQAYMGHTPIIDGQDIRSYGINIQNGSEYLKFKGLTIKNHTDDGIKIRNTISSDSDYIVIDSCIIEDNTNEAIHATGADANNRLSNLTIQNCTIQNNKEHGIYIDDYWDYLTIDNNTVSYNGHRGYENGSCYDNIQAVQDETTYGPDSHSATNLIITNNMVQGACRQGILVWGDIDTILVEGNTSYSNGATGIQIEGDSASGGPKNIVVRNNYVYDNCKLCGALEVWSNAECGIWMDSTEYALIENNVSKANNEGMHFEFKDSNSYHVVRYNTLYQPSNLRAVKLFSDTDYIFFYNNTIHNAGSNGTYGGFYIRDDGGTSDYNVFKNNIISQVDDKEVRCDFTTTTFDYNCYYDSSGLSFEWNGTTYYSLNAWQTASSQDSYAIEGDPKFVDPSAGNFKLQNTSPCIDAGGPLTTVDNADTGSGTSLIVNNAGYFQDGYGISLVNADWIAVGTVSNIAQITNVNYSTNTITLNSSISRNDGDRVWLYKKSDGKQVLYGDAPDIGAYEYVGIYDNLPPTPITGFKITN